MFSMFHTAINQFRYEGDRLGFITNLQNQQEPISQFISPDSVMLFDPELIREVLTKTNDAFTKKRSFVGELVDTEGVDRWMACRRWAASQLSARSLAQSPWASETVLTSRAIAKTTVGDNVDILDCATNFCAETIGKICFGERYEDVSSHFPKLLELLLPLVGTSYSLDAFWQKPHVKRMSSEFNRSVTNIVTLISSTENEHQETLASHFKVFDAVPEIDRALFLLGMNLAGYVVPASPIAWTVLMLETHKEAKIQLLNEITSGSKPTFLDACVKETIRMLPPTWLLSRDIGNLEDSSITLPKTVKSVYVSSYALGRSPVLFEEPNEFNPWRHLTGTCPHTFAFGGGPRSCPGQTLAMVEASTYIDTLYRYFDVELTVNPMSISKDCQRTLIPDGLRVSVRERT